MARSHGTGSCDPNELRICGPGVVIEPGALFFHPENIELGRDVYVGHNAILKAYYKNQLRIGDGTWIGQQVFMHAAGGITIGDEVGIGPGAKLFTSTHDLQAKRNAPILHRPLTLAAIVLEAGCDIGVGAIVMPGVTIGERAQVAAGAVVTHDVPANSVVMGVPARPMPQT